MGREYGRRGGGGDGGRGRDDDRRGGSSRARGRDDDRRGGSSRARGRGRGGGDDEERDRYPAAERISKIGGKCGRCDEPIDVGDRYVLGLDREGGGTCLDCVTEDDDEIKPHFPSEEAALLMRVLRAVEGRGRGRAKTPEDPPAAVADDEDVESKAPTKQRSRKS